MDYMLTPFAELGIASSTVLADTFAKLPLIPELHKLKHDIDIASQQLKYRTVENDAKSASGRVSIWLAALLQRLQTFSNKLLT